MIMINGLKFADSKKAMIDTLFQSGGTASGFYKRQNGQNTIVFYDAQGKAFAHLSRNSFGESFLGNARQDKPNGPIFKQVALSDTLERYFGINTMGYAAQCAFVDQLAAKHLQGGAE